MTLFSTPAGFFFFFKKGFDNEHPVAYEAVHSSPAKLPEPVPK